MGDVLRFKKPGRAKPVDQTLCRNGHHKWGVVKTDPFAVKKGGLITRYRCVRCGKEKNTTH